MEKENKPHGNLGNKLLLITTLVASGFEINYGSKINQIKEITSTYQGYTAEDGKGYLVFDKNKREAREGLPTLVIEGKPDTLKIGEEYNIKYSIRNWNHMFPNRIMEIKYAKPSN